MSKDSEFHTFKGYELISHTEVTTAMEDYIEMICRLSLTSPIVRMKEISENLNVTKSAVSKMVDNLREKGLVESEKYGYLSLTHRGQELGEFLLSRHTLINELLCLINDSDDELEETEKIEHYLSERTVSNISDFLNKIRKLPQDNIHN